MAKIKKVHYNSNRYSCGPEEVTVSQKVQRLIDLVPRDPAKVYELTLALLADDNENVPLLVTAARAQHLLGNTNQAENYIDKALDLSPFFAEALFTKATILYAKEKFSLAEEILDKVDLKNKNNSALLGLRALVLHNLRKYEEAEKILKKLTRKEPNNFKHWNGLGNLFLDMGRLDEADACFEKSEDATTQDITPYCNRITTSHYNPNKTPKQILDYCHNFQRVFSKNIVPINSRSISSNIPNKRIRIGMISDGFRTHPVGNMITFGLKHVSNEHIEFYGYSTNLAEDHITQKIKNLCAKWQVVSHLSAEATAARIYSDKIDILLDLCGYNANSQVLTMMHLPAPIQIKWVGGLISSTGLDAIDYLLSDNVETPPGVDTMYTEKLIRLPNDYICYDPPQYLPSLNDLPVISKGFITFGCFNNAAKVNDVVLIEWAKILHKIPNSKLFLKSTQYSSKYLCDHIIKILSENGISEDRIRIEPGSPHGELLERYGDVDIALDPWPYSGGLTTCEAMVMGVPVVTYPGPTFAGRHSATHLVNAGMAELVATSWENYIEIAVGLAGDIDNLVVIRRHLREVILSSSVCNGVLFAQHFSAAMRAVWQRYCEGKAPEALTLSNDFFPYFEDEKQPISLQYPNNKNDFVENSFDFQLNSKIIVLDNGSELAISNSIHSLAQLNAFHFVLLDMVGSVQDEQLPLRRQNIQHITWQGLGNGLPTNFHICVDADYSSELLLRDGINSFQLTDSDSKSVLTDIPIMTVKLDDVQTSESIDWLLLNNKNDLKIIIENGMKSIREVLIIHVRVSFDEMYQKQLSFSDISIRLREFGFEFHSFVNIIHSKNNSVENELLPPSRMVGAVAIYILSPGRRNVLPIERREKLAFILHSVYAINDIAYELISLSSSDRSKQYLSDISRKSLNKLSFPVLSSSEIKLLPEIPDVPRMSLDEISLFQKYLKKSTNYFEFGSGGSTKLAARNNIEVYGVESDKEWINTLKKDIGELCKVEYVDIGPTKEWGYPLDNTCRHLFPHYSESILSHQKYFDFILVDGRFRVACTLNSIKNTLLYKKDNDNDVYLFIHDFWDRKIYESVLTFLDTVEKVGTAGVFKIKKRVDVKLLDKKLNEYKYIAQ